jgi:hypothetical protein
MIITKKDPLSGKINSIEIPITKEELARCNTRHESNECIQNIVPNLTASQREFLMTGITDDTWNAHFPSLEAQFGDTTESWPQSANSLSPTNGVINGK